MLPTTRPLSSHNQRRTEETRGGGAFFVGSAVAYPISADLLTRPIQPQFAWLAFYGSGMMSHFLARLLHRRCCLCRISLPLSIRFQPTVICAFCTGKTPWDVSDWGTCCRRPRRHRCSGNCCSNPLRQAPTPNCIWPGATFGARARNPIHRWRVILPAFPAQGLFYTPGSTRGAAGPTSLARNLLCLNL